MQEAKRFYELAFGASVTEHVTRDMYSLFADGDRVFLHCVAKLQAQPTGKEAKFAVTNMFRIMQGKIMEWNAFTDTLAVSKIFEP
jgi:limonene-1,2-epoxide hydrolase